MAPKIGQVAKNINFHFYGVTIFDLSVRRNHCNSIVFAAFSQFATFAKNMKAIFLSVKTFIILVVIENVVLSFFTGHETYNNFSHSQKATFFQAYVTLIMLECVLYTIIFAIYSTPEHFRKDHTGIEIVAQDSTWSILLYEACMLWKVLDFER